MLEVQWPGRSVGFSAGVIVLCSRARHYTVCLSPLKSINKYWCQIVGMTKQNAEGVRMEKGEGWGAGARAGG